MVMGVSYIFVISLELSPFFGEEKFKSTTLPCLAIIFKNFGGKGDLPLPKPKLYLDYCYLADEREAPAVVFIA